MSTPRGPALDPKALRAQCERLEQDGHSYATVPLVALFALLDRLDDAEALVVSATDRLEKERDAAMRGLDDVTNQRDAYAGRAETAERREREAHEAIARNDERHAEAIAAVRGRAERAERERDEAMLDGGLDLVRRAVVRAESAERERDEARAERGAAIRDRDAARDEAWASEVDGCKRALAERERRIRAEEYHRAAVESLETYEDRIKDIADHVLGIQPPNVATIVLLDVIERRCGEERIAARQAEAVVDAAAEALRRGIEGASDGGEEA